MARKRKLSSSAIQSLNMPSGDSIGVHAAKCNAVASLLKAAGSYPSDSMELLESRMLLSASPVTLKALTSVAGEGAAGTATVASFTAAGGNAQVSDYAALINWGDGNSSSGTITGDATDGFKVIGTHTYTDPGTATVTVTVSDATTGNGELIAVDSSTIHVYDAALFLGAADFSTISNRPLNNINVGHFRDENPFSQLSDYLRTTIDFGDGTPVTSGTVVDSVNGGYDVLGSHTYANNGNYVMKVAVFSAEGFTAAQSNVSVRSNIGGGNGSAGTMAFTSALKNAVAGIPLTGYVIGHFTDSNADAVAGDYRVLAGIWGDGSNIVDQEIGGIVANPDGGFDVIGSHLYKHAGNAVFELTVADRSGHVIDTQSSVLVANQPLTVTGKTLNVVAGQPVGIGHGAVLAHFTDPNPYAEATDYHASVTWGDLAPNASAVYVAANLLTGGFDVISNHTYMHSGQFNIAVEIAGLGSAPTSVIGNATVANAPIQLTPKPITAVDGTAFTGAVLAHFTDSNPGAEASDYNATASWGDGSEIDTSIRVVRNPTGGFDIVGGHLYDSAGKYDVDMTVSGALGTVLKHGQTSASVRSRNMTLTFLPMSVVEGLPFNGKLAHITSTVPGATATQFTAEITWGDGSVTVGQVVASTKGGFDVAGVHSYSRSGTKTVSIKLTDTVRGNKLTASNTFTVKAAPIVIKANAVTGVAKAPVNSTVATFSEGNAIVQNTDFTATINWGDGTTSSGNITASGSGFSVTGSHVYATVKTYNATITVTDIVDGTVSQAKVSVRVTKGINSGRPVKTPGKKPHSGGCWSLHSYWQQAKTKSR